MFRQIVVGDFEYEISPGGLPIVLCMVAHILDHKLRLIRIIRLWRDDFGSHPHPPFDIGPDTLFVAYSAWAELMCFIALGWRFPENVFDCHTAFLAAGNVLHPDDDDAGRRVKEGKKLTDACRAYGIGGWEKFDKTTIAKDIGEGRWRVWGRETAFEYCTEDVEKTVELLRAMLWGGSNRLWPIDTERVLHWSDYSAKCVARIQARGIPIDVSLWNLVQENKATVIAKLIERFDPSQGAGNHNPDVGPIYSDDGGWSYSRFESWLVWEARRRGKIAIWPRLESGALDLSSDAFKLMARSVPAVLTSNGKCVRPIEALHALRDSLSFIAHARLPIGPDGRNRPSLFPFGTTTGRNAHARSPYNAHAGMRGFMLWPEGTTGFYLDWRSQEVAVAAARFRDDALRAAYESGDTYHALARMLGWTDVEDPKRWKRECKAQRDRAKPIQLGINYGMGVPSLARGLDRHPLIAAEIIWRYSRQYQKFWDGRLEAVRLAMSARIIESSYGWPLRLTHTPNKRSLLNAPMQSDGAEMLRQGTVRLCEAGIVPIMLVHDGVLFEETDPRRIEEAREIMRAIGREVCDGIDVGVDLDWSTLSGGRRYRDKRDIAQDMWAAIMDVLVSIGALSLRDVA
jgi:hypothetical protein